MKFYAILTVVLLPVVLAGCLGGDDDEDDAGLLNEKFIGTFFTDTSNNHYIVSDTTTGGTGELTLFIRNSESFNFADSTRFYLEFNNVGEINDTSFWVDCVDYKVIPVAQITDVDASTPDTLALNDYFLLKGVSISHNYLNIQYYFQYDTLDSHYFYVTRNVSNQPLKDTVEIQFHHKSTEQPPFHQDVKTTEQTKYVISIPITGLQNIYPLQDSVFIRIVPQHDRSTPKTTTVLYKYGQ